ncbi:MAG: hypothetical protein J6I84_03555 [Bacilli bacterium]|nr:hypothetical protein [Bacilli bacterium]
MDKQKLIEVVGKLEGYKTRLKELHWSAPSHSMHIITDEFSDELGKFEDDMTENAMAILGLIEVGNIQGVLPEATNFGEFLTQLRGLLSGIKEETEDQMWSGLVNIVDDFWSTVNRYVYLNMITE